MKKQIKYFKRVDGQLVEVSKFSPDVEYWEETEVMTAAEVEAKYNVKVFKN